jgi:hypothetical protein
MAPSGTFAVMTGASFVPDACADEQTQIGRVDRRRLDADDNLVRAGLGGRHVE